jgi:hypothetical protein
MGPRAQIQRAVQNIPCAQSGIITLLRYGTRVVRREWDSEMEDRWGWRQTLSWKVGFRRAKAGRVYS